MDDTVLHIVGGVALAFASNRWSKKRFTFYKDISAYMPLKRLESIALFMASLAIVGACMAARYLAPKPILMRGLVIGIFAGLVLGIIKSAFELAKEPGGNDVNGGS